MQFMFQKKFKLDRELISYVKFIRKKFYWQVISLICFLKKQKNWQEK